MLLAALVEHRNLFAVISYPFGLIFTFVHFDNILSALSPGTPVSSTNKTDRHETTEILLKVALNTITLVITLLSAPTYNSK
jgi:hypothetical protein